MPSKRRFTYWLYYCLNRYIVDWLRSVSGTVSIVRLNDARNNLQIALLTSCWRRVLTARSTYGY